MAIPISDLTQLTTPADGDLLAIVDIDANATKKITREDLFKSPPLADNSITAAMLATSAVTLDYVPITTTFSTASTTPVQVTGLTSTVTIPAGGRRVEVTVYVPALSANGVAGAQLTLWGGTTATPATVNTGTQLQYAQFDIYTASAGSAINLAYVHTPSAGQFIYNVGLKATANTVSINCGATLPAFLLVKMI